MHPLKSAIAEFHHAAQRLHEATQDFEFTAQEKEQVIDAALGYLPIALGAFQNVLNNMFAYLAGRVP